MVLLRIGVEKEIEINSNLYKSFEIKLIAFLKERGMEYIKASSFTSMMVAFSRF